MTTTVPAGESPRFTAPTSCFGAVDRPPTAHSNRKRAMADNTVPVQWERLRHEALRARSAVILGAPRATTDEPTLTCIATNTPNGDIIITVHEAATLADVHDLCVLAARACLNDDHYVTFRRANEEEQ
jgi:hypothetical protein